MLPELSKITYMNYTDAQKTFLDIKDKNVLISAGAGSGKTTTLTEKIIKIINEEHISIKDILVLTFTNAAANDIKEKIRKKMLEVNKKEEEILDLDISDVGTFHSFFLKMIKDYVEILDEDYSPNSVPLSDEDRVLMIAESIDELIRKYVESEKKDVFLDFYEKYSTVKSDNHFRKLLEKLYEFSMNKVDFKAWLDTNIILKDFKTYNTELDKIIKVQLSDLISDADIDELLSEYEEMVNTYELDNVSLKIREELNYIKTAINDKSFEKIIKIPDHYYKNQDETHFNKIKAHLKTKNVEYKDFSELRNILKKGLEKIISYVKSVFYTSKNIDEEKFKTIQADVNFLVELRDELESILSSKKQKNRVIDFNDIEQLVYKILSKNSEIKNQFQNRYKYVFIDEYQDISEVQNAIIEMIIKENNAYYVGDVKQCIYEFRNSKPELFEKKLEIFESGKNTKIINLSENFRNSKNIIDGVNSIFENLFDYKDKKLIFAKNKIPDYRESELEKEEITFVTTPPENYKKNKDGSEPLHPQEEEALYILSQIRKICKDKNYSYSDIAIIARKNKHLSYISNVLFKGGVPTMLSGNDNLLDCIEIITLIDILEAIDNPLKDVPLIALLQTSYFNFEAEEIFEIKKENKNSYLYDAMSKYIERSNCDKKIKSKIIFFMEEFQQINIKKGELFISDFIWYLIKKIGFIQNIVLGAASTEKEENIQSFISFAKTFEKNNLADLYSFLKYLKSLRESKTDVKQILSSSANSNKVQLMTMHGSKGLEFKIVFIPMLGESFAKGKSLNSSSLYEINDELGISIPYFENPYEYNETKMFETIRNINNKKEVREQIRLFYVALTRAKEKLFLTAFKFTEPARMLNRGYVNSFSDMLYVKGINKTFEMSGCDIDEILAETSGATVNLTRKQERKNISEKIKNLKTEKVDASITKEIGNILEYEYDFLENDKTKETVTGLLYKDSVNEIEEDDFKATDISPTEKFSEESIDVELAKKRGTLYHLVFQKLIHYHKKNGNIDIEKLLLELKEKNFIGDEDIEILDKKKISLFMESKVFEEVKQSQTVRTEAPFVMKYEGMLVQGKVDLFYDIDGRLTVVDYKSSKYGLEKYKEQLDLYETALTKAYNKKTKKIIYIIKNGEIITW